MRRLLAAVPALVLVLSFTSPAQASTSADQWSAGCPAHDNVAESAFVYAVWDPAVSTDVGWHNKRIHLLQGLTLGNACSTHYARAILNLTVDADTNVRETIVLAPGSSRTLGKWGLEHLGLWLYPHTNVFLNVAARATTECAYGSQADLLLRADGHLVPLSCS